MKNDKEYYADSDLVEAINDLLKFAGLKRKLISSDELASVSSSLFVSLFETLFSCRLPGINPNPLTHEDYCANTQVVLDSISQRFDINLHHISGDDIVKGDMRALSNLTAIMQRIVGIIECSLAQSEGIRTSSFSLYDVDNNSVDDINKDGFDFSKTRFSGQSNGNAATNKKLQSFPSNILFRGRVPNRQNGVHIFVDDAAFLLAQDTRDALLKAENRRLQEERICAARRRRDHVLEKVAAQSGLRNLRNANTSMRSWQHRWLESLEKEERSFQLDRAHTEALSIQQVYRAYFSRLKSLRVNEQRELSERIKRLKEGQRQRNENLANLYEDRIRMLESDSQRLGWDDGHYHDSLLACKEMQTSFSERQKRALAIALNESRQDRERMIFERKDAHNCLMDLLLYQRHQKNMKPANKRKNDISK